MRKKTVPDKIGGIDRNVFFIGVTSFLTDTTTKMIYSVMPLFLLSMGASKIEISLIEGVAESTASILKALSGWWSDKIRRNKPFMIVGYACTAFFSPLFAFVSSPLQVLAIRFSERVGKGIRTAPRDSLIAASSAEGARGKNFGIHKALDNSGAILGPLAAAVVLAAFPGEYRFVFLLTIVPGLLGVASILFFVREVKKPELRPLGKLRWKDFSPQYYAFLAIIGIFTLGNSTDALLLIKAGEVGFEAALVPLLYLIFNTVSVSFSIYAGSLSDRIGRERIIVCGYLLYAIIYCGFALVESRPTMVLLFALYGLYSAATDGVQKALAADLVAEEVRGTGLGLYNCLVGALLFPASLIAGTLYDTVNSSAPFYFGAVLALGAAVLMAWFCHGREQAKAMR